jgi:hypothetical protein
MRGRTTVFRKFTTRRKAVLATGPDIEAGEGLEPVGGGTLDSPLTEIAIGVAMMLLALSVAWGIAKLAADEPLSTAALGACTESCTLSPSRAGTPAPGAVLSEDWRWGTGSYRFDDIYGQTPYPAAYSYEFVYPRPATITAPR